MKDPFVNRGEVLVKFMSSAACIFLFGIFAIGCNAQSESRQRELEFPGSTTGAGKFSKGDAFIRHLYHSGFAIETSDHFLIFDYRKPDNKKNLKESLENGFVDPGEIADKNVIVFVSHEHADHFWPQSIKWKDTIKKIRYVVSPEVAEKDERFKDDGKSFFVTSPNRTYDMADMEIKTFLSNDSGVSFLVEIDGLSIYHAGDHGMWNWSNDSNAGRNYIDESLKDIPKGTIDIAMQVCDARLKEKGWTGFFEFAVSVKPKLIIPMHLNGGYNVLEAVSRRMTEMTQETRLWKVRSKGDSISYSNNLKPLR